MGVELVSEVSAPLSAAKWCDDRRNRVCRSCPAFGVDLNVLRHTTIRDAVDTLYRFERTRSKPSVLLLRQAL